MPTQQAVHLPVHLTAVQTMLSLAFMSRRNKKHYQQATAVYPRLAHVLPFLLIALHLGLHEDALFHFFFVPSF